MRAGVNVGARATLSDMGQTVAENFGKTIPHGTSFLNLLRN
jgi:phosphopentomutase